MNLFGEAFEIHRFNKTLRYFLTQTNISYSALFTHSNMNKISQKCKKKAKNIETQTNLCIKFFCYFFKYKFMSIFSSTLNEYISIFTTIEPTRMQLNTKNISLLLKCQALLGVACSKGMVARKNN